MPWFLRILLGVLVLFVLIQLVPYGRDHDNPPSVAEPAWDSTETRNLAQRACFDCHSNVTQWPWYTSVAPASWIAVSDVEDGRAALNFSEWGKPQDATIQVVLDALRTKDMPPWYYRATHETARLTDTERDRLARGLVETWSASPPGNPPAAG
jgi:hypothetical protein